MIRSAMSLKAALRPETYTTAVAARGCLGHDVVAQPVDELAVASSWGAESGVTKTIATVFSSLNCGSPAEATPSRSLTRS